MRFYTQQHPKQGVRRFWRGSLRQSPKAGLRNRGAAQARVQINFYGPINGFPRAGSGTGRCGRPRSSPRRGVAPTR
jgi:hypothetical protein